MSEGEGNTRGLTEASLILAAVSWGLNFAAESIPPLLLVAIRFTVGGLLMLALLRILEPTSKLLAKDLLPMAGLGCLGVAISQTAFTFGVSTTSAANTGLIFATAPVWYGRGLAGFTPRYPGCSSSAACSSSGSWTACTLLQG